MNAQKQSKIDLCKKRIREGLTNPQIMERLGVNRHYVNKYKQVVKKEDEQAFAKRFSDMNVEFK